MTTYETVSRELSDAFTTKSRDDGSTFRVLKDDRAGWIGEDFGLGLHRSVDGRECRLPDDWVYLLASRIATELSYEKNSEDAREREDEVCEHMVDYRTGNLFHWASLSQYNRWLIDEAVDTFGTPDTGSCYQDCEKAIARAQYLGASRLFNHLLDAIETEVEERDCEISLSDLIADAAKDQADSFWLG